MCVEDHDDMICAVCTGGHHAMACPTVAATLLALGVQPWLPQSPGHDGFVAVHDAAVREGQLLWQGRRRLTVPDRLEQAG